MAPLQNGEGTPPRRPAVTAAGVTPGSAGAPAPSSAASASHAHGNAFSPSVREVGGGLGHMDGRSFDFSQSSPLMTINDLSRDESRGAGESTESKGMHRVGSAAWALNNRLCRSMNAFMLEQEQLSGIAAGAGGLLHTHDETPKARPRPSERTWTSSSIFQPCWPCGGDDDGAGLRRRVRQQRARLIGKVPTAPLRDQPVGDDSNEGINLKFKYKLTNLRRKVVHERDGQQKVVRFNEAAMAKFGFLSVWSGTVFSRPSAPFIWIQLGSLWGIAFLSFLISFYASTYIPTVVSWHDFDNESITEVYEVLDEFKVVSDASQVLTTLVSFVLGLYVTKTVDIWWDIRHQLLQNVLNHIDSLCMRLSIYFPGNHPEDDEAKETVLRYGVLSMKLLFKDAREVDAWNISDRKKLGCDSLSDLVDEGLLLDHERDLLRDCPARSQVIWVWIASLFTKWCLDGRLPNPVENQNTILEQCTDAKNCIAKILARVNTQYPLSYSHLVISMVKILLLIQAVTAGYIFALAVHTGYFYWMATQAVYLLIWTIFHQAMIDIKEHITNPFRDNPCDFSEMIQSARTINQCRAFFKAGKRPPYAVAHNTKAAALPPQLIVRQIISSRLKRGAQGGAASTPTGPRG